MASTYLKLPIVDSGAPGTVDSFNARTGVVVSVSGDYSGAQVTNTPAGSIAATDVQAAINELDSEKASTTDLSNHINDATDAHDASAISSVPAGNLAATDVQAALNELDTEKQASGNYITALTSDVTASGPGSSAATIAAGVVTLAKMANLAANSIIGNNTASPATPLALSISQVNSLLGAVTTLAAIGAVPNANAATISGNTLNLQPADASFGGVVTTSAQTFAGAKTFNSTTAATTRSTGAVIIGNGTSGGLGVGGRIHTTGLTTYNTILPDTNQTRDLGTLSTRFRDVNASQKRLFNNEGTATINLVSTAGVDEGNYELISLGSAGTQNFNLDNGTTQFTSTIGYAFTDFVSAIATINNRGNGTFILGGASVFGASNASTATVDTDFSAGGSAIIGAAYVNGSPFAPSTASIGSTGLSSIVLGSAGSSDLGATGGNTTTILNTSDGGAVIGSVNITDSTSCTASMSNSAKGSLIQGFVQVTSATSVTAEMSCGGTGGALVRGFCSRGRMIASNQGALVSGFCSATTDTAGLFASGLASVVFGRCVGAGSITASSNSSIAIGNISAGTTGSINVSGGASIAIAALASSGNVTVSSQGSVFIGRVAGTASASITTGAGNFGIGDVGSGVGIAATGSMNCGQLGIGVNSIASSVRFGETIRILEIVGTAPASNGDVSLDSVGSISVQSTGATFLVGTPYIAKTANYTLTFNDYTVDVTSGTNNQTLPTAVGCAGRIYVIMNSGTGTTTVNTTSSQTINGVLTLTLTQDQCVTVTSNGANWRIISRY